MFEFFIAKKYLKSKHSINFITIISALSMIGITIGVAALIIILSVFNGFSSLVKSILVNVDPHVRIIQTTNNFLGDDSLASLLSGVDQIQSFSPYAEGKVILLKDKSSKIVVLKGIDENADWEMEQKIIFGDYNLSDPETTSKVILGLPVALELSSRVNDSLLTISFNNLERIVTSFSFPRSKVLSVAGIFETNNKEYDNSYIFTSLKSAQNILGFKNKITGYELRLNDINKAGSVKNNLQKELGDNYKIYTWFDLHKDLYSVMLIERWSAYIILSLIIAIATFNILGSLTMTVIEKKKDIGVLRSIGVSDKSILRIFMFEGILVGAIGTFAGLILGLAVVYLQTEFNFYPLDPTKYIIDAMPVDLRLSDIAVVSGMSMLLTFLASLYPARRAAKISILESIKWE